MEQRKTSLAELARAFAHMLPGAGDVVVCGASGSDIGYLRRESICLIECLPADQSGPAPPDGYPATIRRRFDVRSSPFPPGLFAGVWARFARTVNEDVIREMLRILMPGGLMILIAPSGQVASEATPYHSPQKDEPSLKLLGIASLADPSGFEAALYMRSAGTDISGLSNCEFCPPIRFRENKRAGLPGASSVLWGDDSFLVMPDVAPIFPGHLLLLTTNHYLSMGALPEKSHELLEQHVAKINAVMQAGFGKAAFFAEHGATRAHEAGSCIDHAHWHCIPDNGKIMHDLERLGMQGHSGQLMRAKELHDSQQPYFLTRDGTEQLFFPALELPCQFIRLVAAEGQVVANHRWQQTLATDENRMCFWETIRHTMSHADSMLTDMPQPDHGESLNER